MKKTLVLAATALSMVSAPAFAQSSGEIGLAATVTKQCGVGNHLSGASAASGWEQGIQNVTLANSDGQFNGETIETVSFGNVWCNGSATVTLSAAALKVDSSVVQSDTGSFSGQFDLEVTTDAGVYVGQGQDFVLKTASGTNGVITVTGSTPGAFETGLQRFGGADSIKILPSKTAAGTNKRPYAGTYTGYVRFTASPAS